MIILTKLFAYFLALLVICKTIYDYKKKKESFIMLMFWSLTWIGICYVATFPSIFYKFATSLSNQNIGSGTLVGLALIFLFYITYRVYAKANRLEQKIRDIVLRIGIKDINE